MSGLECPSVGVVGESEVDESAEVQHRSSDGEGDAVAFCASVPDPPVSVGDEPSNGSFDHGAIVAVVVDAVLLAPLGACLGEELIVITNGEGPASSSGGATVPHRAAVTASRESGLP